MNPPDPYYSLCQSLVDLIVNMAHWEGCWDSKGKLSCVCGKYAALDLAKEAGITPTPKESE